MQRRLAAILAADIVGYSRLMGADEQKTLDELRDLIATCHRCALLLPPRCDPRRSTYAC